ncbi:MAG: DUF2127 domain-containing protein [Lysobacterales bacterium]
MRSPSDTGSGALASGVPARLRLLGLIAVFKLAKAIACALLAAGAFRLLQPQIAAAFAGWLESLTWAAHLGVVDRALAWLFALEPGQLRLLGTAAGLYAVMYAIQAGGLWFGKRWAEYFVVVETSLLLPFEAWELAQQASALKCVLLAGNVAIVIYLVHVLRTKARPRSTRAGIA